MLTSPVRAAAARPDAGSARIGPTPPAERTLTMSTLQQVITYAREQYGPTPATFDRDYGAGAPAAEQWIRNACWHVANHQDEGSVDERQARADHLHEQLAAELEQFPRRVPAT